MMGNNNGIIDALFNEGKNKVVKFDGGYFSFAFGDEIALVLDNLDRFYILNGNYELWEKVKKEVKSKTRKELIKFWLDKFIEYEVSDWSDSFLDLVMELKEEIND